jgi:hypothetical protein
VAVFFSVECGVLSVELRWELPLCGKAKDGGQQKKERVNRSFFDFVVLNCTSNSNYYIECCNEDNSSPWLELPNPRLI